MPQRFIGLITAVAGLATVLLLALAGVKLHRAAATGPRWKRKLVTAGLLVLAMFGLAGCGRDAPSGAPPKPATSGQPGKVIATDLSKAEEWAFVTKVWREASEVASGKRGQYPFDEKGKKQLLADLQRAGEDIGRLGDVGLLSAPERKLLARELSYLSAGVQRTDTTEKQKLIAATCYDTAEWPTPSMAGMDRLAKRLPLLRRLAESETLNPLVIRKVLPVVEADVALLSNDAVLGSLQKEKRDEVVQVAQEARKLLGQLRALLPSDLSKTAEWAFVTKVWREASEVASGKRGQYPFDERGKKQLLADMVKAEADIDALGEAGLLSTPECGLLKVDLAHLTAGVHAKRPTEMRMATCYEPMMFTAAQDSMKRLAQRLPMLEKLAATDKLAGPAVKKILGAVETDVYVLAEDATVAEKAEGKELLAKVRSAVASIKSKTKEGE